MFNMKLTTIKNLLEVNKFDTLGTAFLKKATKGYFKGVLAAGAGLGALAVGYKVLADKAEENSEKQLKEEESINKQLEQNWEEIEKKSKKDKELVDAI